MRRILGHSLLRSLVRSHHSLIRLLRTAHSFACSALRSFVRSLAHSGAHGKEVYVYELNASISYSFSPLCINANTTSVKGLAASPKALQVTSSLHMHLPRHYKSHLVFIYKALLTAQSSLWHSGSSGLCPLSLKSKLLVLHLEGVVDCSECLVAERVEKPVTAKVEITNVASEDDFSVDFEPKLVPVIHWNQLGDHVTVPRQHLLQSLKSVSSVGDDSIGQVRPVIHEHFGKLRHCLMECCSFSLLPIHCTSASSGIVSWNVALSSPALFRLLSVHCTASGCWHIEKLSIVADCS